MTKIFWEHAEHFLQLCVGAVTDKTEAYPRTDTQLQCSWHVVGAQECYDTIHSLSQL